MRRNGVTPKGHRLWTKAELDIVRVLYPDYEALQNALPERTYFALRAAARTVGVTKARHRWTAAELSRLRKLYPVADWATLCSAFPNCTQSQIQKRAKDIRLRRETNLKPTGSPELDAIRKRATDIGWSMVDLDKMARTRQYFQKAMWHNTGGRPSYTAVRKAVAAMDGRLEIQVVWND